MDTINLPGFSRPILLNDILWLKGEATYTRIYYKDGSHAIVTKPLNYFSQHSTFIRVHRSIMVNSMYVHGLIQGKPRSLKLQLSTGTLLDVSRPYYQLLGDLFPSK
ncbi:LytTR family DNA-binding domain-containing protein [Spirosoma validum]|uniref:LytTR family transcriptional regulator n=1 Tax=Spirosoma validum TaxID=2771355 RepID=A0A927AY65_9BACT|nr:LytTR family DNA-binding domain-containing protein [Spirosoma validum]MBD2752016.1 LytTR family transcriptional regulator [Spirosoma validum]